MGGLYHKSGTSCFNDWNGSAKWIEVSLSGGTAPTPTSSPGGPNPPSACLVSGVCTVNGKTFPNGYCSPLTGDPNNPDTRYCCPAYNPQWPRDTNFCKDGDKICIGNGFIKQGGYLCCAEKQNSTIHIPDGNICTMDGTVVPTPTPTSTPGTKTPTATMTPSPTPTKTPTPLPPGAPTLTPTIVPTMTPTPIPGSEPTPTFTPTPSPSETCDFTSGKECIDSGSCSNGCQFVRTNCYACNSNVTPTPSPLPCQFSSSRECDESGVCANGCLFVRTNCWSCKPASTAPTLTPTATPTITSQSCTCDGGTCSGGCVNPGYDCSEDPSTCIVPSPTPNFAPGKQVNLEVSFSGNTCGLTNFNGAVLTLSNSDLGLDEYLIQKSEGTKNPDGSFSIKKDKVNIKNIKGVALTDDSFSIKIEGLLYKDDPTNNTRPVAQTSIQNFNSLSSSSTILKAGGTIDCSPISTPIPSLTPTPAAGEITSCGPITLPGNYYVANDLTSQSCDCIVIDSVKNGNISINGNGKSITQNSRDLYKCSGIYIKNSENITVENFRISQFQQGIFVDHSSLITIRKNDVSDNYDDTRNFDLKACLASRYTDDINEATKKCNVCLAGGRCGPFIGDKCEGCKQGAGGIKVNFSNKITIEGNTSHRNIFGTFLNESNSNILKDNDVSDNTAMGIYLVKSSNNNVYGNNADNAWRKCEWWCIGDECNKGCDSTGILIERGSNNNNISNNSAKYGGDGIFQRAWNIECSNNNTFSNNDTSYAWTNCIEASFCDGNTFIGNKANYCGQTNDFYSYGMWLGYSTNVKAIGNEVVGNKKVGITIEHGVGNKLEGNIVKDNNVGIHLWQGSNKPEFLPGFWQTYRENPNLKDPYPSKDTAVNKNILLNNQIAIKVESTDNTSIVDNKIQESYVHNLIFEKNAMLQLDSNKIKVNDNQIINSINGYTFKNIQGSDVDATNNSWGANDINSISNMIFDKKDDPKQGVVIFQPYKTDL